MATSHHHYSPFDLQVSPYEGRNSDRRRFVSDRRSSPPQWLRLLPIVFFVVYLTFTVFLFAFGPWPYQLGDVTKLYGFLTLAHLALLLGYLSSIRSTGKSYKGKWSARRILYVSVLIGLPVMAATIAFRVRVSAAEVAAGSVTLGEAYKMANDSRNQQTPIIEYVRFFVGPWLALVFPLAVFYWKCLSKPVQVMASLFILGNVGMFVLIGTNKLIADTLILLPWLILASTYAGFMRLRMTGRFAIGVTTIVLFGGFLLFFKETQSTRLGLVSADEAYSAAGRVWADNENFMVRNLTGETKLGVLSGISYLSHGYYGLYLALDKPFVPTFGVGNSFFLARQAARIPAFSEVADEPYPMRIEEDGWDAYGLWSTIYPWIASDFSFPGTLVVVFFIGRVFALCWLDTLQGSNPFAVAMFAQFATMLYYFNANNQCLQSGEGFSAFSVLLGLWLWTRRSGPNAVRTL